MATHTAQQLTVRWSQAMMTGVAVRRRARLLAGAEPIMLGTFWAEDQRPHARLNGSMASIAPQTIGR